MDEKEKKRELAQQKRAAQQTEKSPLNSDLTSKKPSPQLPEEKSRGKKTTPVNHPLPIERLSDRQLREQRDREALERFQKTLQERKELKEKLSEPEQASAKRLMARLKMLQKSRQLARQAPAAAMAAARQATQQLSATILKQSWLNLITSWGLTYFYILFHFIGAYLGGPLSDFFCKFGKEWLPKGAGAVGGGGNPGSNPGNPQNPAQEGLKITANTLEIPEIILFLFCTAIVVGLVFLIFTILGILGYAFEHPIDFLKKFATFVLPAIWELIKAAVGGA